LTEMGQKGFAPIIIILSILIGGAAGYLAYTKAYPAWISSVPVPTNEEEAVINTPTPQPAQTPAPAPKPTVKPTPVPATPAPQNNTCSISVLSDPSSPNSVRLTAGATSKNGSYIKGAQWDFDGNGSWDTDMSISNQNITHNYPNGTYTAKLKTSMSDGSTTDVCSKSVSTPYGFSVSLTGYVYEDINCNDMREPSERGLTGVTVKITNMNGYANLATLTTDSSGFYRFTYNLAPGNSITVKPHDEPLPNYGVTEDRHQIALNSSQNSINMDLGQIPSPVGDYCGF